MHKWILAFVAFFCISEFGPASVTQLNYELTAAVLAQEEPPATPELLPATPEPPLSQPPEQSFSCSCEIAFPVQCCDNLTTGLCEGSTHSTNTWTATGTNEASACAVHPMPCCP